MGSESNSGGIITAEAAEPAGSERSLHPRINTKEHASSSDHGLKVNFTAKNAKEHDDFTLQTPRPPSLTAYGGSWFDKLTMIAQSLAKGASRACRVTQAHRIQLDKLAMILFVFFVAWLLCVSSSSCPSCLRLRPKITCSFRKR
jgi:hypothetical protein